MRLLGKLALPLIALAATAPAHGVLVQWTAGPGANNHYYDIVQGSFTFAQALAQASSATPIAGYAAHLVTITSQNEANFVFANFGSVGSAWAAGSDSGVEGVWTWLAGPETGQVFWNNGTTVTYANWQGGEPNNAGDEDGLILHQFGSTTWNDGPLGSGLSYIVEYSPAATPGVPEPATWLTMILGFGLIGGSLRARRQTPAFA